MIAAVTLLAALQQPVDTGRPCTVVIDSMGHFNQIVRGADTSRYGGGGVFAHCRGTGSTLAADSFAWSSVQRRLDLVRNVRIRDTALALDATNASYFLRDERLEAHRNVVAVNRETGSELRGPNLSYWRKAQGVRDTVEMYATGRPTIVYRSASDSGEPYVVVGDRVRFKGNDRMWAGGKVTIDRSDLAIRADSARMDETVGFAVLVGKPRVEGKAGRPYSLAGTRIEMDLEGREIELVRALGEGEATGEDWRLTADTIHLAVQQRKLQQAFAWGDSARPHAVSTEHTVQADSLVIDTPDEMLKEMRAFGRAFSTSRPDTAAAAGDLDWITGDTLVARFEQVADSAGDTSPELRQLLASGSARSFTHMYDDRQRDAPPSLNYSRGTHIAVSLKGDRIDRVVVSGRADGVHLEPQPPPPPDSTRADTTRADTTRTRGRP